MSDFDGFRDLESNPNSDREVDVSRNLWRWHKTFLDNLLKKQDITAQERRMILDTGNVAEGWTYTTKYYEYLKSHTWASSWTLPLGQDGKPITLEEAHVRGLRAEVEKLVDLHPEMTKLVDREIRRWPVNTLLRTALEDRMRFRKVLSELFDLEQITFVEESQILAIGDASLKSKMEEVGMIDVNGFRGWYVIEFATNAMKTRLFQLRPEMAAVFDRLNASLER